MARKRIGLYWPVLMVMLLAMCLMMAVGQTHARYADTTVWNTVVSGALSEGVSAPAAPILKTAEDVLVYTLTQIPQNTTVELLTSDGYTEVETLQVTREDTTVTIRLGQTPAPAGTYRLTLQWSEGEQTQTVFFINYSDTSTAGGAV